MSDPHAGPVVPEAQPQSRGCAVAGLAAGALVAVVAVALTGWYVLGRDSGEAGDFEAAPECGDLHNPVLEGLVPSSTLETEEQLGGSEDTFGTGWQCRWATPEGPAVDVPAFASAVAVAAPEPRGPETAAGNLRETSSGREARELTGIGDEALAWVEEGPFTIGCVATRVSNLYLETCYSAAADYEAMRSAEEEQILDSSRELAEAFVDTL